MLGIGLCRSGLFHVRGVLAGKFGRLFGSILPKPDAELAVQRSAA